MLLINRLNKVQDSVLSKLIYRFKAIPIKIQYIFFMEFGKLNLNLLDTPE